MKTLDQILAYLPPRRQAKIAERSRQLIDEHVAAYRKKLEARRRRLIAELFIPCGNPEVSGEVAKADVGKVVDIAAFHRDNQK